MRDTGAYTFTGAPRPVSGRRKYRDPADATKANLMSDRRVVRGSTVSNPVATGGSQLDPVAMAMEAEAHRRKVASRKKAAMAQARPATPPAVPGRAHMDIQTEPYLEEITDKVIEAEVSVQTDAFLDRPPTPLFMPMKTGTDASTQVEPGELFDFNMEVEPLLEVLVGKTIEQALMEVAEEDELAALREHQKSFERKRLAELAEVQRLEEAERRKVEEKTARLEQDRARLAAAAVAKEKIAARGFSESYLSTLVDDVCASLDNAGYFYDPVAREVETQFMPALLSNVQTQLDQVALSHMLVEDLLSFAVGQANTVAAEAEAKIAEQLAAREAAKALKLAELEKAAEAADSPDADVTIDISPNGGENGQEDEEGDEEEEDGEDGESSDEGEGESEGEDDDADEQDE